MMELFEAAAENVKKTIFWHTQQFFICARFRNRNGVHGYMQADGIPK